MWIRSFHIFWNKGEITSGVEPKDIFSAITLASVAIECKHPTTNSRTIDKIIQGKYYSV